MSKNFFAALDDEEEPEVIAPPKVAIASKSKPPAAGPSKEQRVPNNNDRNTKGGRGERAPTRSGKRAYDRRSGTGRGNETKKEGGGARNWGNDKNDARKAEGPIDENDVQTSEPTNDGGRKERVYHEEPVVPVVEEVDNTISFEEYMQQKAVPGTQAFAPTQERQVDNDFANVTASVATEKDFLVMGDNTQKSRVREEKKKQTIVAGFKVVNSDFQEERRDEGRGGRGRGERGGRGERSERGGRGDRGGRGRGDRGGRGRGRDGGRGPAGRGGRTSNQLNTMDADAFPSL